jgi:hypothetical protein
VTLHFIKKAQAPGIGWRGQRFSCTRDYLIRPASVMRIEARESLRLKRKLWSAEVARDCNGRTRKGAAQRWKVTSIPQTMPMADGTEKKQRIGEVDRQRQLRDDARRPFVARRTRRP